jgi:DNA-binding transcriptional regulator PaaX
MPKLLASDILILGLAIMGDMAEEIFIGGGKAYKHRKLLSYFPPGYKKMNLAQNVYRQIKNRHLKEEQGKLTLTKSGINHIRNRFPLTQVQQESWNKKWCIVSFDVPEIHRNKRDSLRRRLEIIGFAQLHKSIYISPHSFGIKVNDYINDIGLSQYCFVLVGKQKHLNVDQDKIQKLWKLPLIAEQYNQVLKSHKRSSNNIIHDYLAVAINDPHLPYALLPNNWPAKKVKQKIKNLPHS